MATFVGSGPCSKCARGYGQCESVDSDGNSHFDHNGQSRNGPRGSGPPRRELVTRRGAARSELPRAHRDDSEHAGRTCGWRHDSAAAHQHDETRTATRADAARNHTDRSTADTITAGNGTPNSIDATGAAIVRLWH